MWDWKKEKILLRSKGFSQEILNARFSPFDDEKLTTSGTGHIRFWQMANTFTGLKLKGYIGKFGLVDLSDVVDFTELPDGKILSSSESGRLLLWEGNFIKCEICRLDENGEEALIHDGDIKCVRYDHFNELFVTAGSDGYMRWWKFNDIDSADATEDSPRALIKPHSERLVHPHLNTSSDLGRANIHNICQMDSIYWLIADERGVLWKLNTSTEEHECVLCAHAGSVSSVDSSSEFPLVATAGKDGTVRAWDITKYNMLDAEFCAAKFPSEATCVVWCPPGICSQGNEVLVGFKDGVVRSLALRPNRQELPELTKAALIRSDQLDVSERGWIRRKVFKPHNDRVNWITFRPSFDMFVTGGDDGNVFFVKIVHGEEIEYEPLGFIACGAAISKVAWAGKGQHLLVTMDDETFMVVNVPMSPSDFPSIEHTFEIQLPCNRFNLQLPDKPNPLDNRSGAGSPGPSDDDEEGSDEETEKIDPETLRRHPGKIKSVFESPWNMECSDEVAISSDARQEISKFSRRSIPCVKICVSVERDLREFLLEVIVAQADIVAESSKSLLPVAAFANSEDCISSFNYSETEGVLLIGARDGSITIRSREHPFYYARVDPHDSFYGDVSNATLSHQGRFLVSTGQDGCINVMRCGLSDIKEDAKSTYEQIMQERKEHAIVVKPGIPVHPRLPAVVPASSGGNAAIAGPKDEEDKFQQPDSTQNVSTEPPGKLMPLSMMKEKKFEDAEGNVLDELARRPASPNKEANEIVSQDAYSLQDAKLKAEDDQKKELAEVEKDKVRQKINDLRKEFGRLRAKMGMPVPYELFPETEVLQKDGVSQEEQEKAKEFLHSLYPAQPAPFLSEGDLIIDREIHELVSKRCEQRIEEAKKEVAFDVKKAEKGVEKLEKAFLEDVKVDSFVVKGIRNPTDSVNSFRDSYLSPSLRQSLDEIKRLLGDNKLEDEELENTKRHRSGENDETTKHKLVDPHKDDPLTPLMGEAASIHGNSFNARKERRLARKRALETIEEQRPGPDDVRHEDVEAIKSATENTGAYTLKTDPHFYVPEHKQVDAAKKRRQMVLLEKAMHTLKDGFNNKLLQLRAIKEGCKETIAAACQRILLLNRKLGDTSIFLQLKDRTEFDVNDIARNLGLNLSDNAVEVSDKIDFDEWPEGKVDGRLDKDKFKTKRPDNGLHGILTPLDLYRNQGYGDRCRKRAHTAFYQELYKHAPSSMFSVSSTRNGRTESLSKLSTWPSFVDYIPGLSSAVAVERALGTLNINSGAEQKTIDSELSRTVSDTVRHRWECDRRELLSKIAKAIEGFDEALRFLKSERVTLTCDLKAAELRFLALFRELQLLRDMAKQDNALSEKLNKSLTNKSEIQQVIAEYRSNLQNKGNELQEWSKKEEELAEQFRELVPDTHEASSELFQIFKRKIKRRRQLDGEDESDSDSEIDLDESDSDEDDDLVEDRCPDHCPQSLFEQVLELRETRLDQEETIQELQKEIDELKKNYDRQVQKEKQIDKELEKIRRQMQEFQSEKQGRLNEVEVATTLKFSQIFAGTRNVKFRQDPVDEQIRNECHADQDNKEKTDSADQGGKTQAASKASKAATKLRLKEEEYPEEIIGRYKDELIGEADEQKEGRLTSTLDQYVLMSRTQLSSLQERIDDLKQQITSLKGGFKTFDKHKRSLQKERKHVEEEISEHQTRCEELQQLKFGQTIDLEHLDKVSQTKNVEKAESELNKVEDRQREEVNSYSDKIKEEQRKVIEATRNNTVLLQRIGELTRRQAELEQQLNSTMESKEQSRGPQGSSEDNFQDKTASIHQSVNALVCEEKEPRVGSEREQAELQQLIEYQAQQIDLLQQQINALRFKGGRIYSAASNAQQGHQSSQSAKRAPPPSDEEVRPNALDFDVTDSKHHGPEE